jgi:hypothetical protein
MVPVTTTNIPPVKIYNDIYWRTPNIGCPAGVGGEAEEPGGGGGGGRRNLTPAETRLSRVNSVPSVWSILYS